MATEFFVRISSVCVFVALLCIALHCVALLCFACLCQVTFYLWKVAYKMILHKIFHVTQSTHNRDNSENWNALSCFHMLDSMHNCTFKNLLITEAKANSAWKISRIEFNLSSFHFRMKRIHFTKFPPAKANYFIEQTILLRISVQKHSQMCSIVLIFWMVFICHGIAINICFQVVKHKLC